VARYRDDVSSVVTVEEWKAMAHAMDLARMGGPAPIARWQSRESRRRRITPRRQRSGKLLAVIVGRANLEEERRCDQG
jgi:hypothetical protein